MSILVTKKFINTLRKAKTAVVRFDGKSTTLELDYSFHGKACEEVVNVSSNEVKTTKGCWSFSYLSGAQPSVRDNFSILSHFIKKGDELTFYVQDNSTIKLKEINYETINICARIIRSNSNGEHTATFDFTLDSQTIEQNCIARNIVKLTG